MAKVLIIDDEPHMRRLVRRILHDAGHEVVEAQDGDEGILRVKGDRPDIVITDIVMPEKEGIATILDLRRQNPSLPILAISGNLQSEAYLTIAEKLGADATWPSRSEQRICWAKSTTCWGARSPGFASSRCAQTGRSGHRL
jgi:two-component system, chemotaxis family, chemotaxis protein CheY